MTSLQTVVMGLVIVFLDIPPDGFDWIADPLGWILVLVGLSAAKEHLPNYRGLVATGWVCFGLSVLTWPAGSVANLTDVISWLFSIPTLAWCFVLCDALMDLTTGSFRLLLLTLRNVFALAAVLPGLDYLLGVEWVGVPAAVLLILTNLVLLVAVWAASDLPVEEEAAHRAAATTAKSAAKSAAKTAAKTASKTASAGAAGAAEATRAAAKLPAKAATTLSAPSKTRSTGAPERTNPFQSPATRTSASDTPVTGAEVVEKVRKRRARREQQQAAARERSAARRPPAEG